RLEPHGIRNCLELRNASGLLIRRLLTVAGHDLWLELNGVRTQPIRQSRSPHKNIARGGSLAGRVKDPRTLYGWLVRNLERLIEELHYHNVRPWTLFVYLNYADADAAGAKIALNLPCDRFDTLLDAAKIGLRRTWRPGRTATHMHVVASNLVRPAGWQ